MKKYIFPLVLSLLVSCCCLVNGWGQSPNYHIHVTSIATPSFICRGDSVRLSSWNCFCGVPPYTYLWQPTTGVRYDTARCTYASPSHTTTYTITVTDQNGVSGTASVRVLVDSIHVSITGSNICLGSVGWLTAAVSGSNNVPPYTYSWSPSGGTNATATIVSAGTYTLTVTDSDGCSVTKSDSIKSSTIITLTDSVRANVTCNGGSNGSASVSVSGGTPPYAYSWSGGGTNSTKTGMTAGTYTVTLTDGCGATATAPVIILQPPPLIVSADTDLTRFLTGDSLIAVGGTPPYTYSWSPPVSSTSIITMSAITIYTLTVTDAHGCSRNDTAIFIPLPTGGACGNLFISEYVQDTANNDLGIELYNPTSAAIALDNYYLGGTTGGSIFAPPFTIKLSGSIPAYQTYVIANSHADASLKALADMLTDTLNFSGKDVVELLYIAPTSSGVMIALLDKIGDYITAPADSGWAVDSGSTKNHTLVRQIGVEQGDVNWTTCQNEWNVEPQGTFSDLGHYTNICTPSDPLAIFYITDTSTICGNPSYFLFNIRLATTANTHFNNFLLNMDMSSEFYGDSVSNGGVAFTRGGDCQPDTGNDYSILTFVNISPTVIQIAFGDTLHISPYGANPDTAFGIVLLHVKLRIQNCQWGNINFGDTTNSHIAYYTIQDSIPISVKDSTWTDSTYHPYPCPAPCAYNCDAYACDSACVETDNSGNCILYSIDSCYHTCYHTCTCYDTAWYYVYGYHTIYSADTFHNAPYSHGGYTNSNSFPCVQSITITDFNSPIDAGVDSILTITGYNFGYPRGTGQVLFMDADNPPNYIQKLNNEDYISWTNTQIKIRLPAAVDSFPTPVAQPPAVGGGNFIVENLCGDTAMSRVNLRGDSYSVYYNISQAWNTTLYQKDEVLLRSIDSNGGYIFHLNPISFPVGSYPRKLFAKAMRDWTCYTGMNWSIGRDTIIAYNVNNPPRFTRINYVFFTDSLLPHSTIVSTTNSVPSDGCIDSIIVLKEGAIFFNSLKTFVYDSTETVAIDSGQEDFYGVCLHELGHFMQLNHTTADSDLMFWIANQGPIAIIDRQMLWKPTALSAVDGAIYSVHKSVSDSESCSGYLHIISKNTSCINTSGIKEVRQNSNFVIYPNPTRGTFTIETKVNEYTLIITNILGQRILTREIQSEKSVIALSTVANGMYFIQEQYKNGIATQKLIIQK